MNPWHEIATLMQREGINAKELAEIAGVGQSAVTKWKRGGRIGADKLQRIALHFGVAIEDILPAQANPFIVRETRATYGTPAADICRLPETCDLPARLDALEKGMDDIRTLLVSLLAEERSRHAPPDTVSKAG